jgi:hypothetical protein
MKKFINYEWTNALIIITIFLAIILVFNLVFNLVYGYAYMLGYQQGKIEMMKITIDWIANGGCN